MRKRRRHRVLLHKLNRVCFGPPISCTMQLWHKLLALALCLAHISSCKKLLLLLIFSCALSILVLTFYTMSDGKQRFLRLSLPPAVNYTCNRGLNFSTQAIILPPTTEQQQKSNADLNILLIVETQFSAFGRELTNVLESLRFKYTVEVTTTSKNLPVLTTGATGKYGLIIFENIYKYVNMDSWNREFLDKYCHDFGIGLILFMQSRENTFYRKAKIKGFPLYVTDNVNVRSLQLNVNASFFNIVRATPDEITPPPQQAEAFDWVVFHPDHASYEPILLALETSAKNRNGLMATLERSSSPSSPDSVVLYDKGLIDGVKRVIFGYDFRFWLCKLLLIDILTFLTEQRLTVPTARFLQIDIDDIFVGETGFRMLPADVLELAAAQQRIREYVPGFKFNLGFSGKFYHRGSVEEQQGDDVLLEQASEFCWFPHMWRHNKVHKFNESVLEENMSENRKFAQTYDIPVKWSYAVAPHHSGVYPVHEPLYSAWKKTWSVQVTSTEEYPHFKPASRRRGFIHRGIMVLPRQTCGLYTHTVFADKFPGGRARLDQMILGGELFFTVVYNPFLIFMTHQSNYANDRLALYTFETLLKFVQCWTNLRLKYISPLQMAERYFRRFPDEREPTWGNPCLDKRHVNIWAPEKICNQLPNMLIVGPQKSGTTALYSFLNMHPGVISNFPSPKTFEEVQFFSGRNYKNGIDWYMEFFPVNASSLSTSVVYEKSATYFDHELVPNRVKALLPNAKLISIIIDPSTRAYSWYQHMRAKNDVTATSYSFFDVLSVGDDSPKQLWNLRDRCLSPGMYAQHLERWFEYFPTNQMLIVDGATLKEDPPSVMLQVQRFLGLKPELNYSTILKYEPKKGFYCQVEQEAGSGRTKCLGRSKGRQYPQMDDLSRRYLQRYFRPHNIALQHLLVRLGVPTPRWLENELKEAID